MNKTIAVIITSLILIASACKRGSNSPGSFYTMTATVDTVAFKADGPSKAYITGSAASGLENTDLYGKADDGKVIQLTLMTTPGTPIPRGASIPVNTAQAMARYYPNGFTGSFVLAVTGSITLNAIAPNYEGTFSFTCADSTHITAGKFTIKAP